MRRSAEWRVLLVRSKMRASALVMSEKPPFSPTEGRVLSEEMRVLSDEELFLSD